jgi:hypothetical protein
MMGLAAEPASVAAARVPQPSPEGSGWVLSIWAGGTFGRWFGIAVATVNAIVALLSVPAYPFFWSLAVFAVDVLVIHGLAAYDGDRRIRAIA